MMESLLVAFTSASGHSAEHTVYCKRHSVRQESELTPNGSTLFTLGWPPYCRRGDISSLFSRAGSVTRVFLQRSPGPVNGEEEEEESFTFRVGYVVFSSSDEVTAALGMASSSVPVPCVIGSVGLSRWIRDYRAARPSVEAMESTVETAVARYDSLREKESRVGRKGLSKPDKEGWITVMKRGPRTQPSRRERRKKKKKELLNFYSFQQRETQRERVAELRKQFEQDKQKVAKMKERRKFKPF